MKKKDDLTVTEGKLKIWTYGRKLIYYFGVYGARKIFDPYAIPKPKIIARHHLTKM